MSTPNSMANTPTGICPPAPTFHPFSEGPDFGQYMPGPASTYGRSPLPVGGNTHCRLSDRLIHRSCGIVTNGSAVNWFSPPYNFRLKYPLIGVLLMR